MKSVINYVNNFQLRNVWQTAASAESRMDLPVTRVDPAVRPLLLVHLQQRFAGPAHSLHLRLQPEASPVPAAQGLLLREVRLHVLSAQGGRGARVGRGVHGDEHPVTRQSPAAPRTYLFFHIEKRCT